MGKNLFLDGMFDMDARSNDSPSAVFITMPNRMEKSFIKEENIIAGLMANDPTWTASNKWGPIISDLSNLQDWASLIGANSQISWINASTMCWKGTSPLLLNIDFYLINYSNRMNVSLENQLTMLTGLAAIQKIEDSNFRVHVHGGYASDVLSGNNSFSGLFTRKEKISDMVKGKGPVGALNSLESSIFNTSTGQAQGAISVRFGHKAVIDNLLVSKINVTPSTIEVANQDGSNRKPLYYRVSLGLTGVRPLITTDIASMYGNFASRGTEISSYTGSSSGGTIEAATKAAPVAALAASVAPAPISTVANGFLAGFSTAKAARAAGKLGSYVVGGVQRAFNSKNKAVQK